MFVAHILQDVRRFPRMRTVGAASVIVTRGGAREVERIADDDGRDDSVSWKLPGSRVSPCVIDITTANLARFKIAQQLRTSCSEDTPAA